MKGKNKESFMATIKRHKFDESKYEQLENYMASGCTGELSDEEADYLELLSRTDKLNRKYGMTAACSYLEKHESLSPYLSKQIYYEAINLFYKDIQIDIRGIRSMLMEKYMKAAELVMATAKNSKDIDVYKNILIRIEEIANNLQVEEKPLSESMNKPNKIYTIDPSVIGLPQGDRNEIAAIIDNLKIPEKVKHRIRRDAKVIEIDFMELLDEQEEDYKDTQA